MSKTIEDIMKQSYIIAKNKGLWEPPPTFGDNIALMHSELSDVIIRVCELCEHAGIDLDSAIAIKMGYNATRQTWW